MKILFAVVMFAVTISMSKVSYAESNGIKLYVLDCGRIKVSNMAELSESGEYNGQQVTLVIHAS